MAPFKLKFWCLFRKGSVIADILLRIKKGKYSEVESILKDIISDENYLGSFKIDTDSILFDPVKGRYCLFQ